MGGGAEGERQYFSARGRTGPGGGVQVQPYDSAMADALAAGDASMPPLGTLLGRGSQCDGRCGECQASRGRRGYDSRMPDDHTCFCSTDRLAGRVLLLRQVQVPLALIDLRGNWLVNNV